MNAPPIAYERSIVGTIFTVFFSLHNLGSVYMMTYFFASFFEATGLTWRAWVYLALTLIVIIFQVFAIRSLYLVLTKPSALHDPIEGKRNKLWIIVYVIVRLVAYIVSIGVLILSLTEMNDPNDLLKLPMAELGVPGSFLWPIFDAILLVGWSLATRKKGVARQLSPFVQVEKNQFPA